MTDRRRRQKEQRAAKREAQRKSSARRELARRLLIAFGFGGLVVAVFAIGAITRDDPGTLPGSYEDYRRQVTACGAQAPEPETVLQFEEPVPQDDLTGAAVARAVIETSCGTVTIELDHQEFPTTVNSFVFLAREGFYDGQVLHRIFKGFVVQGGDPRADGSGGPGYRIADEFPPEEFVYEPGVVAMANVGRGTTGSQFFIVLGESASALNPQFNVLGRVVSGQQALSAIEAVPTARRPGSVEQSLPLETVYIESVRVEVTGS